MGHRSIEFVKTHFALPMVIDQYCDLYNQVLGARSFGGVARPAAQILLEGDVATRGLGGARR